MISSHSKNVVHERKPGSMAESEKFKDDGIAWDELEDNVRKVASYLWNRTATTEHIEGVDCDCVVKVEDNHWVLIEITKRFNLTKVREDATKIKTMASHLIAENIFPETYIVLSKTPTNSMREAGTSSRIKVLSYHEFQNMFFDYESYCHCRTEKQFGSLVNAETGSPENNTYISVNYTSYTGDVYHIQDVIDALKKGRKLILKGDFGSGKSRCIKEVFDVMKCQENQKFYTISINLREHWGAKDCKEILRRHFGDLGLKEEYTQNFIKAYENPNIIYLLDGFDEMGTQQWSADESGIRHSREMAVAALKDLIMHAHGGILLCGREFYFNSDEEMFASLGFNKGVDVVVLRCPPEFSDEEIKEYIRLNCNNSLNDEIEFPRWFPKRPLVMQILFQYANDSSFWNYALSDIYEFWTNFLEKICQREARIHHTLNADNIKKILVTLAQKTRYKADDKGPLTLQDLFDAYELSVGVRPTDETAIMLQRLPGIGRIQTNTPDRQFLDSFILNGLRAEYIIHIEQASNGKEKFKKKWKNFLDIHGIEILAEYIQREDPRFGEFLGIAKRAMDYGNPILASDILSSLAMVSTCSDLDGKGIHIAETEIGTLLFEGKCLKNISITNSLIHYMDITNTVWGENVHIDHCVVGEMVGITSEKGIPAQITEYSVDRFQSIGNVARIKRAKLTVPQKILVTIIKKTFFQSGSGRKEEALLRGLGVNIEKKYSKKIINKLVDSGILIKHKGDEGWVYTPERKYSNRMNDILTQLTMSQDEIWTFVTGLEK